MEKYIPPFEITQEMLMKVSDISEKIGKLDNFSNLNKKSYLKKQTKINSIYSSLAIENNNLTIGQVKDVIDGKFVIGEQKDIQEVKNAYKAYEILNKVDPYSINDLKKVHGVMTFLTVDESGEFRKGNEGVFDGDKCIFMCPPPEMVTDLINNLFSWIQENKDSLHPLILSSVFHYEFVFIHPFSDGNGRTVRLWQNILLYNWKEIFEYLPIESQIHKYQNDYYTAIANCNSSGSSTEFIVFMLKMIDETLNDALSTPSIPINEETININNLLDVMEKNIPLSANEIMAKLNIKSKDTLRNKYLHPAIEQELVKLTIPDKPNSRNQMYYKD
jgi:Fic family protein